MSGLSPMRRVAAGLLAVLLLLAMAAGPATWVLAVLPASADPLIPPQVTALAAGPQQSLAPSSPWGASTLDRGPPAACLPPEEITTSKEKTCCEDGSLRRSSPT